MSATTRTQAAFVRFAPDVTRRSVDPLGPTDVDPDDVRDQACSVTAPSRVCDPRAPSDAEPPDLPDPGWLSSLADLLILAMAVALVVGLVWLISRLVIGARRSSSEDADEVEDDLDESFDAVLGGRSVDHETPPREWRRLADEHLARGEYRDAVRCRYRALVGELARAGYVDETAGRTSGEERAQVTSTVARLARVDAGPDVTSHSDRVTASFDRAAGTFDVAWFDDGPVTAEDHDRFLAAERIVLEAVESGPGTRRPRIGSGR